MNNMMMWGLPVGRIAGIRIRLHWLLLLFWVFEAARVLSSGAPLWISPMVVALSFGCILLHEFGHSLTARAVGGHSDEILLWPLGGLAYCDVPGNWRAKFLTASAGPAVTLSLILLSAGASVALAAFSGKMSGPVVQHACGVIIDWQI